MWTSKSASSWCSWISLVIMFGVKCFYVEGISNARFNSDIREYSDNSKTTNTSEVRTLQKQDRVGSVGPPRTFRDFDPVQFKLQSSSPDNDPSSSSSSYGRGFKFFPHNEYSGQGLTGYEGGYDDKVPIGDQFYQQPFHEQSFHEPHYLDHGQGHGHGYGHSHEYGHGHYNKHNALAVKSFLIPLAGIALLGAAAALVTNPVLLQLGVVSGRRRRRRSVHSYSSYDKQVTNNGRKPRMKSLEEKNQPYRNIPYETIQKQWNEISSKLTPILNQRLNPLDRQSPGTIRPNESQSPGLAPVLHQYEQVTHPSNTLATKEYVLTTPGHILSTLQRNYVDETSERSQNVEKILDMAAKKYEMINVRGKGRV